MPAFSQRYSYRSPGDAGPYFSELNSSVTGIGTHSHSHLPEYNGPGTHFPIPEAPAFFFLSLQFQADNDAPGIRG